MKKFIFIFALAIAAVACDTQPDASLPGAEKSGILNIASGDVTFTTEGGTSDVKVLSTDNWTARLVQDNSANKEEWCSINTKSGIGDEANPSIIKVTATPNSSYADRTAKLYVSSGNYNKSITITQKQMDAINVTVIATGLDQSNNANKIGSNFSVTPKTPMNVNKPAGINVIQAANNNNVTQNTVPVRPIPGIQRPTDLKSNVQEKSLKIPDFLKR